MKTILSFGEVLADIFPSGYRPGGAPANFAWYCCQLGAEAFIASAVGRDLYGAKILSFLKKNNMSLKYIQRLAGFPTGTVKVKMDKKGVPSYKFLSGAAYDNINADAGILKLAASADVIYFGTLAQRNYRSARTLRKVLSSTKAGALKFFDVNLRQNFYRKKTVVDSLKRADILKASSEELPVLASLLSMKGGAADICARIRKKYKLKAVIFTRGASGSIIFTENKEYKHKAVKAGKVAGTVGAGDAFAAFFCLGYLAGADLSLTARAANAAASYVCTRPEAMVKLPEKIKKAGCGIWKKLKRKKLKPS